MAVDQELNAKDVIEIDRWLWREFESLALYLANKRGYHLTEKLPVGGRKWFDNDLICGLIYLLTAIWTACTSTISVTVSILSCWQEPQILNPKG